MFDPDHRFSSNDISNVIDNNMELIHGEVSLLNQINSFQKVCFNDKSSPQYQLQSTSWLSMHISSDTDITQETSYPNIIWIEKEKKRRFIYVNATLFSKVHLYQRPH